MSVVNKLLQYRAVHLIIAALLMAIAASAELLVTRFTTGAYEIPAWAVPFVPIAGIFGDQVASAFKDAAKDERLKAVEADAVAVSPGGATAAALLNGPPR